MNLARVEHYFATFLSAMEEMYRNGSAEIPLTAQESVRITPNLKLIGTVNIDETTHGFADKVFDRAQLIELKIDEESARSHIGNSAWSDVLIAVWREVQSTAPFAFRVIDDINRYIQLSTDEGVAWREALDEQIEQKVLPKLSGNNANLHVVLGNLQQLLGDEFPLSSSRAATMLRQHDEIGFVSFFS